jgi:replicative DNA helicase
MTIGKSFMAAVIAEASISALVAMGPIDHLFTGSEEAPYKYLRSFVKQYSTYPTLGTLQMHTGEMLTPAKEPSAYYLDLMQIRHVEATIKKAGKAANEHLDPENKNVYAALDVLTKAIMMLANQKMGQQIVDFRDAYEIIVSNISDQFSSENTKELLFGWPYLDKMTQGLAVGDVVSMIGRPALGKTWFMLKGAMYGWNMTSKALIAHANAAGSGKQVDAPHAQSRLFVSMEMKNVPILQRMSAMQVHIPAHQVKNASVTTKNYLKLKEGLGYIHGYGAPFWVVDGDLTATVEDIYLLARQLKPDAIFIDGGYILKHPTERDRFRRVAENVELIKTELASIAPTVCSWQFAKSASKKLKQKHGGEKVDLDDIGYSDAIAQFSSLVLGLLQGDTIEAITHKVVDIMKGRHGETGQFKVSWDFLKMVFDELDAVDIAEMQFP